MTNFDLISDLYLTSLDDFNWSNKATSLYCIIAGNITADRSLLFEFLDEIQHYYNAVFFVDGELEHTCYEGNIEASYRNLIEGIEMLDNTVFMYENIIILNDTTLIGANGWTTFDFTNRTTVNQTIDLLVQTEMLSEEYANEVFKLAISDQHYMYNSVEQCQQIPECKNLIIITNTVPDPDFISHNADFDGTILGDTTGNNGITGCLSRDIYGKVNTWVFGKFHDDLDYNINGIRYVSNPGKEREFDTYFPKRIEV